MSNKRKIKTPRGAGASGRQGNVRAVGTRVTVGGERISRPAVPALPEAAATSVHVVTVSLEGADPPVWRRLEVPSAVTLDRLHELMQEVFAWENSHLHAFETAFGDFGPPGAPEPWSSSTTDEAGVALAQVAGAEGAEIVYVYDFGDDWRHDIVVEKIVPAEPGVAYPRCTAGRGEDVPGEDRGGIWTFNAERAEDAADDAYDGLPIFPWADDVDPEIETYMLKHLATVIVPRQ
jgi:hypothetical protein